MLELLFPEERDEELEVLLALLREEEDEDGFALVLLEGFALVLLEEDLLLDLFTEVLVAFLSSLFFLVLLLCASTVKAKNNIAIMILKFFMTIQFK